MIFPCVVTMRLRKRLLLLRFVGKYISKFVWRTVLPSVLNGMRFSAHPRRLE